MKRQGAPRAVQISSSSQCLARLCRPDLRKASGFPANLTPVLLLSLTYMYELCMLVHMRTTLIIDENLLERARQLTGIRKKTALVRAGLEALIAREAARRLAALAGAEPRLRSIPRRRSGATR